MGGTIAAMLVFFGLYCLGLILLQRLIIRKKTGLRFVLPVLVFLCSCYANLPNFREALAESVSPGALGAAVLALLLFNAPTLVMTVMVVRTKRRMES